MKEEPGYVSTFSSVKASKARQTVENDPCPRSFTSVYLSPTCISTDPVQVQKKQLLEPEWIVKHILGPLIKQVEVIPSTPGR